VHIKLLGDLPVGSGGLEEARLAARYLGKYVGKALDGGPAGLHRYEVAQGFQPRRVRVTCDTLEEALERAGAIMGGAPAFLWDSGDDPGWGGPHAVWASWTR
jgi:hypothetical protein